MTVASSPAVPIGSEPVASRPSAWARLRRNSLATAGLVIVVLIIAVAAAAPLLPLADPNATEPANRLRPPFGVGHLLGTDQLGRDILSRLVWGTGVSLAVGIAATLAATLIGSAIGLIAAMYGRIVDNLLMRGIDVLMAFPYLLLALAIVAALGPGLLNALLAIAVVNIPFFARAVRGTTVSLVHREYIDAARLFGYSKPRIIVSEILPNVLPIIIITISTTIGWMILETAGLSFLGLGAQPPQADLGSMLADGRNQILGAPHVALIPGLLILVLVIGVNLLGDGLRDVLDPRLKSGALARPVAATDAAPARLRATTVAPTAAAARPPILSVRGLETQFLIGKEIYRSVGGVSFDIGRGEAVGVVGESGSGKSVTALSILGLVPTPPGRITGGQVLFYGDQPAGEDLVGAPLSRLQDLRGRRIAYIFQDPLTTLNPLFRVGAQVAETIRRHQGLTGDAALLFISHDFGVVSDLCERVLVMYAGQIVESGPVTKVFSDPRHPYTRRLMACVPVLGQPERSIDAIPGLPPAVNRLPPGCAFAPRCHMAVDACRGGDVALDWLAPDHAARCIRAREAV